MKQSYFILGMISSAMIWGFLFDVLGRRKLLIFGFLVDAIFVFTSAFAQSLPLLLVSKYLQGLMYVFRSINRLHYTTIQHFYILVV